MPGAETGRSFGSEFRIAISDFRMPPSRKGKSRWPHAEDLKFENARVRNGEAVQTWKSINHQSPISNGHMTRWPDDPIARSSLNLRIMAGSVRFTANPELGK